MTEPVITLSHLQKSFGTHAVLRDIDLSLFAGEVVCVIGSSGSGKSTMLRCVNLLETPTGGGILFQQGFHFRIQIVNFFAGDFGGFVFVQHR